jgi:hypothetical protein
VARAAIILIGISLLVLAGALLLFAGAINDIHEPKPEITTFCRVLAGVFGATALYLLIWGAGAQDPDKKSAKTE